MRARTVWLVVAAVNVLWAAAFIGYTQRSTTPVVRGGEIVRTAAAPAAGPATNATTTPAASTGANPTVSNAIVAAPAPATNISVPRLAVAGREFGWQDVTNATYKDYMARLRLAGCPEKQVRSIVVADVNELFDKRRLQHAVQTDTPWWKSDNFMGTIQGQLLTTVNFDQERREILETLLGEGWDKEIKLASLNSSSVNLSGPVLGALPLDTWNSVQEVCARSMERAQSYQMARLNDGKPLENAEMAKLRNFTRTELAKVLTPEQLEEFLLRYSHNASRLRQDLRGIDVTPEEFRKVFRAIDPIEHQVQLDYGGPESLSPKQRDQMEAQRDRAIREALAPERYTQYQLTKDPLYKQAQMLALQYGMTAKAIQPIYQLQRTIEAKRTEIAQNAALTPEQKAAALQSVALEQQQTLQRMLGDASLR